MRALRCHALQGPSSLSVDDVPEPTVGDGEVLIDVRAAGLNFPDVLMTYGRYQFKHALPFVPGGEVAGVVRAVGRDVHHLAPGNRVAATMLHGAFAEQVVVPEAAVVQLPDSVGFEVGAATLLTYLTTAHALIDRAALREGETLLVLGAAGGVGLAAVQLGRHLGAHVIAAASSDAKLKFCVAQGAHVGINYARDDLKERTKSLTDGRGADVIYDPVGGVYSEAALRAIAWQGRHLVVGFAAGEIPRIPLNLTLLKGCQVVGVFWGQFALREPARNRAHGERVMAWVADASLAPHVDGVYTFAQARDAFERMERREVRGKLVLTP